MSPRPPLLKPLIALVRRACLLLPLIPAGLHAAAPELLLDINTQNWSTNPGPYVPMGNVVLLQGIDLAHGSELWKSDGTPSGTGILADLTPGPLGSPPSQIVVAGRMSFFRAAVNNPGPGSELWKTDGTAAGTVLVKDINPGSAYSSPASLTPWGSRIAFTANDGTHGTEMWISDGTDAGTTLLKDLSPGSASTALASPAEIVPVANALYFTATPAGGSLQLWKSDGSDAGTVTLGATLFTNPKTLVIWNGSLVFTAVNKSGVRTLWKSDGSETGTVQLASHSLSATSQVVVLGNSILFEVPGTGEQSHLYRSNGTPNAAVLVKSLTRMRNLTAMPALSGSVAAAYFSAQDAAGVELWRSDGTTAGTVRLLDLNPGTGDSYPDYFTAAGSRMFFRADHGDNWRELWVTDGTAGGTRFIRQFDDNISYLAALGNNVVFTGDDGIGGREFWASDGTAAGTRVVKDFRGTRDSEPWQILSKPGQMFFWAVQANSMERLFLTDGTTAGTKALPKIKTNSNYEYLHAAGYLGDLLLFSAQDAAGDYELWKSDGTDAGTVRIKDIRPGAASSMPNAFNQLGNISCFFANDGVHGNELWRTDGTEAGTALVKDAVPGPDGLAPAKALKTPSQMFYTVPKGTGVELWRSNGEEAGTVAIASFNFTIPHLTASGELIYFLVRDDEVEFRKYALWRSDGTPGGTFKLAVFYNGLLDATYYKFAILTGSDGLAYVAMPPYFPSDPGIELWRSDGSVAGTRKIYSHSTLKLAPYSPGLVPREGGIYFWLQDAQGNQLWRSDGTQEGTRLVAKPVKPDSPQGPLVYHQMVVGNDTWFLYGDSYVGYKLWKSDGTTAGTGEVPMAPPAALLHGTTMNLVGNKLLFTLTTDAHGEEFYVLPLSDAVVPSAYSRWADLQGLSGDDAAPDAVPHADRLPNLLKYAFFMDGSRSDRTSLVPGGGVAGLPVFSLAGAEGARVLRVEFVRRKDSGLTYSPKISTSLNADSFLPMGGAEMVTDIDAERERVVIEQPIDPRTVPRGFGVVEVSGP